MARYTWWCRKERNHSTWCKIILYRYVYNLSDIDSDCDYNDSLDALEEADIDYFEDLERHFLYRRAKKLEKTQSQVGLKLQENYNLRTRNYLKW